MSYLDPCALACCSWLGMTALACVGAACLSWAFQIAAEGGA